MVIHLLIVIAVIVFVTITDFTGVFLSPNIEDLLYFDTHEENVEGRIDDETVNTDLNLDKDVEELELDNQEDSGVGHDGMTANNQEFVPDVDMEDAELVYNDGVGEAEPIKPESVVPEYNPHSIDDIDKIQTDVADMLRQLRGG